jgi:DNA-binding MarR family transcriptional regulator
VSTRRRTTAGLAGESRFSVGRTKTAAIQGAGTKAGSRQPKAESRKAETLAVADRLHSAAIQLLRRVRRQDIATGEGPARLSALSVLVFGGPKTLKELAADEQVKPPTMSRIVAGLARSRLVQVGPDREDRRRLRIHATVKGRQILRKGRERRIAYLARHLDRLSAQELSQLRQAVEILARLLQNRG